MPSSYFQHFDCEVLPPPRETLMHGALLRFGLIRNEAFYMTALALAHKLLREAKAGRALLLLDRAMSVRLQNPLHPWPVPYSAVAFILNGATPAELGGNPRIHYEHLATRLKGDKHQQRIWRAWACWMIVRKLRPEFAGECKPGVEEPRPEQIAEGLRRECGAEELELWQKVIIGIEAGKEGVL